MNKLFKFLEIFWLITAIISALIAVYFLIIKDTQGALYFILVFVFASILYLLRKHQRKIQQKVFEHNSKIK